MMTLEDVWPLFRLRLSTPRLVLHPLRDEDIPRLVDAAASGVHDPARTPFAFPWTDAPAEELPANTARWVWRLRISCSPAAWTIPLGVSRRLGYVPNGENRLLTRPGVVERELNLRLAREDFRRPVWELMVDGAEAAAAFLGVARDDGGRSAPADGLG